MRAHYSTNRYKTTLGEKIAATIGTGLLVAFLGGLALFGNFLLRL